MISPWPLVGLVIGALAISGLVSFRHPQGDPPPPGDPDEPARIDPGPPRPPAKSAKGFHVRGATILGPDGLPFVAHGVNVNGYQWVWPRRTVPDAGLIANCWRFNTVRVNSFLSRGEVRWPQYDTNDDLDAIVRAFTSRGIVTVLEAHDHIGGYYEGRDLDHLCDWLAGLARRYRSNPYVWFDLMNEPGGEGAPNLARWVSTSRRALAAVRDDAGAPNMVLVEGASWAQDAGPSKAGDVPTRDSAILSAAHEVVSREGAEPYPDVAFSIHVYEEWNGGDARLADYLDRAAAQGIAIVVGEYGTDNGDSRSTQDATAALFRVAPPRGIGRIAWHWNADPPNVLTDGTSHGGGWQIDSCAAPTNLSWMGRLVWDDNHESSREKR